MEKINAMITGLTQYHRTAICSRAFSYIDDKVYKCAEAVFKKKYDRKCKWYEVPLDKLSNRPQRHKGYRSKTFAILHEGMYIGITKAFLTHSQWEAYCFNHKTTPYTENEVKIGSYSIGNIEMDFGMIDTTGEINGLLGLDLLFDAGAIIDLKELMLRIE